MLRAPPIVDESFVGERERELERSACNAGIIRETGSGSHATFLRHFQSDTAVAGKLLGEGV